MRWFVTEPGGDQLSVHTEQDATRVLMANARDRDVDQSKRAFRLAARIPLSVIQQAAQEGWLHDKARWRRWLNDPDNRHFRVWGGKV
jgi:hypothetical protein